MIILSATTKYKNHRFPVEIISHAVWLYFRFCLSFRDVEELLCERGVGVTYETIRKWCRKFGQQYANQLRRRRPRLGDKWHMDEVFLTIKGELMGLFVTGRPHEEAHQRSQRLACLTNSLTQWYFSLAKKSI